MTREMIHQDMEIIGLFMENSDLYVLSETKLFKTLMFSKEKIKV